MNQFRPSGIRGFRFNEKYLSQILAMQQLIHLGFEYLTPEFLGTREQLNNPDVIPIEFDEFNIRETETCHERKSC